MASCHAHGLEAKNTPCFVDGSLSCPVSTSSNYPQWIRCNSMVRSWLIHFTIPIISYCILRHNSSNDVWNDLCEYFSPCNAPRTI
ncbi:hypothetical protein EUGRSUZ_K02810 [Eucalyptus grandis]|uniref:Uncharacterized protein n=2 Tax=Eucalyptus grandis TaxID=71139 RepID=A0ACC3IXF8_EUCGR|nr:hypothetical protein EUGRSUZ_K02810 [Eucalyptus grandis]